MGYETIRWEKRGSAGWITLNRPEALNSLSASLLRELEGALGMAESDPGVRTLVITGAGRAFCAGADLKAIGSEVDESFSRRLGEFLRDVRKTFDHIEALRMPTIAAVNGLALAGGLELLLCCDLVVAAHDARFGDAHANYGLLPGGGSSIRLPRKIGSTRAKYMLFTGEFLPADEMREAGLVNRVVDAVDLPDSVQELADALATKSPLGLRHMKELVSGAADQDLAAGLAAELAAVDTYGESEDIREGLSAFNEKRKPLFTGR